MIFETILKFCKCMNYQIIYFFTNTLIVFIDTYDVFSISFFVLFLPYNPVISSISSYNPRSAFSLHF